MRTGTEEILVADADGSNPVQMTFMGGPVCTNPRWSPDGQTIVFQSTGRDSPSRVESAPHRTGKIDRLTDDPAADTQGSWSGTAAAIYFASDRTGRWEIWKMPAAGGPRTQITNQGGLRPIESRDGRFLYYAKTMASPTAIWRVPVDGGEETPIVEGLSYTNNFAVGSTGLYFVAVGDGPLHAPQTSTSSNLRRGRGDARHTGQAIVVGLGAVAR